MSIVAVIKVIQAGHTTGVQWLFVLIPTLLLLGATLALVVAGRDRSGRDTGGGVLQRAAATLERRTSLPAWAAGGLGIATWALVIAFIGFVWDVAWHVDFGRDRALFTVPHVLILEGLLGIGLAGVVAIALATVGSAPTALRIGRIRLPWSAVALCALSGGAALGFPLDDLWHRTYGIDVTMWGPTHLLMIGGASFTPIALWLLYAEAGGPRLQGRGQRRLRATLASGMLVGLSTFQLEFDLGVPQWQALYHPVLIMAAATLGLVAARVALGRFGALRSAVGFLGARVALAALVGPGLGHVMPHFPLYLGIAALIEIAFRVTRDIRMQVALSGLLAGTVGLASEWAFSHVFGRAPWQASLLPGVLAASGIALASAPLGAAAGALLAGRRVSFRPVMLGAAAIAVVALLAVPFPRRGADITATVATTPVGQSVPTLSPDGVVSAAQEVLVTVTLSPRSAADRADWFVVNSWQSGRFESARLLRIAPGVYRGSRPVATGGTAKAIVFLEARDVLVAAPVSLPQDREYQLPAVAVSGSRTAQMVPASNLLMRETHDGASWPAAVAYGGLALTLLVWIASLLAAFTSLRRRAAAAPADDQDRANTDEHVFA